MTEIRPQQGQQENFLMSSADIVVYGGAAGSGKTYALLLECLRHVNNPEFTAVIFRRQSTQVRNPGGLWDTSMTLFPLVDGKPRESVLEWDFPSGAKIKFAHMEHEKNRFAWQGSQIPLIGFDEATHFSYSQFIYMLSRNRSTCGIKPYIRMTTNPDPDSWVKNLISWWLDEDTGYPIPERSGNIRWFVVINDQTKWADTKQELLDKYPDSLPKSLTFISANIYDNKILMSKDPGYLANLKALPKYEREQLLSGNWNIRPTAGMFFKKEYFEVISKAPKNTISVRYWDRASTRKTETNDPDYTVGLKIEKDQHGIVYITDMIRIQESPLQVQKAIKNMASQDGTYTTIGLEQDPGQAGVVDIDHLVRNLHGYNVKINKVTKDKVTRSLPVSAQAEAGNIKIVESKWNQEFFNELENFPDGSHDDIIDALSGGYDMLTNNNYNISAMARL